MKNNCVYILLICFFFGIQSYSNEKNPPKPFVVVLDAGHGGKDPGNRGNGFYEKHIALDIVLQVGKLLEDNKDIKVIYTRKTDVFVPLHKRADIANDAEADLFVSVHCNAASSSSAHGTETFVLGLHNNKANLEIAMKENSVIYLEENYEVTYDGFDPKDPSSYIGMTLMQEEYLDQSILLADFIQREYTNTLKRKDRGVKQAGLLVLRETYMPSVLTEVGFLTNKTEGTYLNSTAAKNKVANSIKTGIVDYKNSINLHFSETPALLDPKPIEEREYGDNYDGVLFKVQIAAGSTAIETASYNFKGLKDIERTKEGKFYKYYYGKTSSYKKAKDLLVQAQEKGYKSGYLVAFKEGKKISVNEALKSPKK
ncbi:N-acetylmuramoyl-L-alanine amidase [Mesonia ostreae]|uniref:N-acetylmuramoyl-L-alanine amidase n=1 Tax=Mesonia ostreae TaxID=861110 RepID=A0ABU2KI20_9FLAO|nr:N-acetylmuramoyl-L-alanine amidase [Mesonia ostreae]MDT0294358.1 N-acetylmuramoyl-L-alanine amidase [Mesonia ostreae]